MNKAQLLQQVIAHLETALSQAQQAAQTAYEAATDEENIAENKYDTLGQGSFEVGDNLMQQLRFVYGRHVRG
jgi:hypothetical protein